MKVSASKEPSLAAAMNGPHPDGRWCSFMTKGNAAFRAANMEKAIAHYLNGFIEAERLLRIAAAGVAHPESDPASALVVAASNAASVHGDRGHHAKAQEILQRAAALLRATISDETAPSALRKSCLQHLTRALADLVGHMRRAGADAESIAREIDAAKYVASDNRAATKAQYFQ